MRKSFTNEFKSKVVLEALRESCTLQELADKYQIHPNQIGLWKKQALELLPGIFERSNKKSTEQKDAEKQREQLYRTVGEMKIEVDFLKKKYRQIYGHEPNLSSL